MERKENLQHSGILGASGKKSEWKDFNGRLKIVSLPSPSPVPSHLHTDARLFSPMLLFLSPPQASASMCYRGERKITSIHQEKKKYFSILYSWKEAPRELAQLLLSALSCLHHYV